MADDLTRTASPGVNQLYIFGTTAWGKKYNSEFRCGQWKFQERQIGQIQASKRTSFAVFSMLPIEKAAAANASESGILSRYDVHVPDGFADAHKHYGHTN